MNNCVKFEIIERNEIGTIAICDQCSNIHIEIGTFTSVVSLSSFENISSYLAGNIHCISEEPVKTPTGEKILIPVAHNTFLTLDRDEFHEVVELFEMSVYMLKVKEIFEL